MKCILSLFLMICLLAAPLPASGAVSEARRFTVLFTHDLHSHVDPISLADGTERGGFAKIGALIAAAKEASDACVAVDAGDFSMGTLYQTVFQEQAPELRLMGAMGIDATTLGNHEFDYTPAGLVKMLESAVKSGDPCPVLLQSNIDWENSPGEHTPALKQAMEEAGAKDYLILERGGVCAALFGLMGENSAEDAPTSGLAFSETEKAAKEVISRIKEEAQPDILICLSHSGTSDLPKYSEDELLAKAVPEIDVIVSGHSHTRLDEPIRIGDTWIVSCGEYGANLGSLTLAQQKNGRWQMEEYQLIPVGDSIAPREDILEKAASFEPGIDAYLDRFGFGSPGQTLAYNPYEFPSVSELYDRHEEQPLGNLIADAYRYAVCQAREGEGPAADVSIVPVGVIRETFRPGEITVSDVYEVSSLGVGEDGIPGYPLVSVYLTGKELKTVAEIDASVSPLMPSAQLQVSGLSFSFNPYRLILDRVTDVKLMDTSGNFTPLEDGKLYEVVSGLYSAQMLGAVEGKSMGLLSVTPKDETGTPVTDYTTRILRGKNGNELKEWEALASYLSSFEKGEEGLPLIPASYSAPQGRKVVEDNSSLSARLTNPGRISLMLYGIVLLILLLIAAAVFFIVRHARRRKQ